MGLPCIPQGVEQIWKCQHDSSFIAASHALLASFQSVNDLPSGKKLIDDDFIKDTILAKCFHYGRLQRKSQLSGFCLEEPTRSFKITSFSTAILQSVVISSAKSSYSHPDLLMIHHHPSTFSDHTSPQHWSFTFWATTAISRAITGLICCLHGYLIIINNCWRSVPLLCGQYKAIFFYKYRLHQRQKC